MVVVTPASACSRPVSRRPIRPRWAWGSIRPGSTKRPSTSTTSRAAGASGPTAAIRRPVIATDQPSRTAPPTTSTTRPPVIRRSAAARPAATASTRLASSGLGWLVLRRGCVAARGVVPLVADQRRPEHAGHLHVGAGPNQVVVVLVQGVHDARTQLVHLIGGQVDDLPLARDDQVRLQVVGVAQVELGARGQLGPVQRKVHAVVAAQDPAAAPARATDVALGPDHLLDRADDQTRTPSPPGRVRGGAAAPSYAAATIASD